jgi:hypothetical protein
VASVVALIPLYQAMCAIFYLRSATAIETAIKYGIFFIVVLFAATWWPPVQYNVNTCSMAASSGFRSAHAHTNPLHQAMFSVLF